MRFQPGTITALLYEPENSYLGESIRKIPPPAPKSQVVEPVGGFLFWPDELDHIAEYVHKQQFTQFKGMNRADIRRLAKTVMAQYYDSVRGGSAPFTAPASPVTNTVAKALGLHSITDKTRIQIILAAVETLAANGVIKMSTWNPALEEERPESEKTTIVGKLFQETYGHTVEKAVPVVVTGAVVFGLAYLLGKEWLFGKR